MRFITDSRRRRRKGITLLECIILVIVFVVVGALVLPVFLSSHPVSMRTPCISNTKQMMLGVLSYADDNDDRLPTAAVWIDQLGPYTKNENLFHDYEGVPEGGYGHSFRSKASKLKTTFIVAPDQFVILFDSSVEGRNAHSDLWSLPNPGRHNGSDILAFADGHARGVMNPSDEQGTLSSILKNDAKAGPKK